MGFFLISNQGLHLGLPGHRPDMFVVCYYLGLLHHFFSKD